MVTVAALDRKLLRDLWRLRGQVLAVALIVGSGVAVLLMSLTSLDSLDATAAAYYERYNFAEVFANVKRAPESLARRVAHLPGVRSVETRISKLAILDVAGFAEPVMGQVVSIPEQGQPLLNRLALRAGRWVTPGRPDEVILSEPFAEAHGLAPGDRLQAILNGHKHDLTIVGIALSPEYVYAIGPGTLMPDELRFGVLWMGREALAAAYDLDGAFNDLVLSLLRGTEPKAVIHRLDQMLARYGGTSAYARKDQISNWFLMNELEMLRTMSRILPTVFLGVAAFLTNTLLARLIAIERSEIGLLKAFGYSDWSVGWHYAKLVIAMTGFGILLGWAVGAAFGRINTEIYAEFYRFPLLLFQPGPGGFALGAAVSLAAGLLGAFGAVRRAIALPPAEAMRPPAPPLYSRGVSGQLLSRAFDQPTRMILRQIVRWPARSLLTVTGIAMAVAVLVTSLQWIDSIDEIVETNFSQAQRQDMRVGLVEAQSSRAVWDFEALPGVLATQPGRIVSANLRAGNRVHRGAVTGLRSGGELERVYDVSGEVLQLPPEGLVLSTMLAEKLGVRPGESVWVEVLEGRRPLLRIPVAATFETHIGMPAYMDIAALNREMKEPHQIEYVNLLVDAAERPALFREIKETPKVASVMLRRAAIDTFHDTMGETLLIYVSFFVGFSCTLAFGVVYNTARIALSERGRELATLRVLGSSRWEVSYILLGEIGLLCLIGLPLGCLCGFGLAWVVTSGFETELFRVPLVIEPDTYGKSMLVVLAAAVVSALAVRRRLDRLDLIAVLKTRE